MHPPKHLFPHSVPPLPLPLQRRYVLNLLARAWWTAVIHRHCPVLPPAPCNLHLPCLPYPALMALPSLTSLAHFISAVLCLQAVVEAAEPLDVEGGAVVASKGKKASGGTAKGRAAVKAGGVKAKAAADPKKPLVSKVGARAACMPVLHYVSKLKMGETLSVYHLQELICDIHGQTWLLD